MKIDNIIGVEIDNEDRLRIYPEKERFVLIWRTATEVQWNIQDFFSTHPSPENGHI